MSFLLMVPGCLISIHPPRVGWDAGMPDHARRIVISIHPPRVGWDCTGQLPEPSVSYFNPPTPCGVGRLYGGTNKQERRFQSTHPVWGGTLISVSVIPSSRHFNPPTPCGVGPIMRLQSSCTAVFQSTHPVWGGTGLDQLAAQHKNISIHPPRVGWDSASSSLRLAERHFNPPTPCGVGLV